MSRNNHAIGISIATLLAGLAAACTDGASPNGGGGQCGEEEVHVFPLDSTELGMLEANPGSCMDVCRDLSYADPITCSWTAFPDGDPVSEDASTSPADGSTSTTDTGATAGDSTTTGATAGDATTTGDASTSGTSTGASTTTGDATISFVGASGTAGADGAAGELFCTVWEVCVGGRGHGALLPAVRPRAADALGEWLAAMAHSEAASVVAFRAIADELAAHGAPPELVQRAREAADDEVRHAEVMGTLARRRGVEPARPHFAALAIRELEALALENAVEGCVRETWAALEAACQARRAADPELRGAMMVIAADESRHAQLSWDIDAWARSELSPAVVAHIDAARRAAVEELERGLSVSRPAPLHTHAGIPEPTQARALLAELRHALWS